MWVGNYTAANVSPFHGSSKAFVQEGPETWLVLRSQTYFVQSGDKVYFMWWEEGAWGEVTYLQVCTCRPVLYWLLVCYWLLFWTGAESCSGCVSVL